ncbi:MAG: signal peptidase I [Candidatus Moraniibacteriota bacterium]|nr:MAG: signal peptidase I [Candidatus Moranbacteria bacterium]
MIHERQKEEEVDSATYGVGSFLLEIVKVFLLAVIIIFPVRVFLFQPFFVQGASMEPNFYDGEYLIVNEWRYKKTTIGLKESPIFQVEPSKELSRGDVVVFRYPKNPSQFFVKRVIGLPGERIHIENSFIMIFNSEHPDGMILDEEEYLEKAAKAKDSSSFTLKDDEYFVMGDNRQHSHDSRSWGPLQKEFVIGKVVLRAWPIDRVKSFFK